jgi:diaminohydroxyphosphoribosylaminopyrimidine deaminase/5-amino-6-(5-phosphoribosylamino)uracil reductase
MTNRAGEGSVADDDIRFMRRALALARRGRRPHPNPFVGAVVVGGDGRIAGEGFHLRKGEPHAETMAFAAAGAAARGGTVYVTLEPCSFEGGGRTPCVARCLAAGVRRAVVAMEDPDARVSGRGLAQLRERGVAVTVGVEEARARALNVAYVKHRTTGLPFVVHKAAMTLDGKIATANGDSRWVTGEKARACVHRLRDRADALVVGAGTVRRDDPLLTTRLARGNGRDPLRVILDSRLSIPPGARVARPGTLVATTAAGAEAGRRAALEATGVEVVEVPPDAGGRVDVVSVAKLLAERGKLSVLLESGGEVAASFWQAGLVDRALFFIAPKIVGGNDAKTPVEGAGRAGMADAVRLGRLRVRRWGDDVALEGEVAEGYVYRDH